MWMMMMKTDTLRSHKSVLNALNGFSFQLLQYFSYFINNIFYFSKKETNYLFILRDLSYFPLYI